ncbi:hypothetical protein BU24DRAFT_422032 [Aaosphaeria arxii CBS 175.79]|uniref:Uncharacterized protein n=1 Tax=Aaosphaeria arxii CBS 175.79 TaxID=1450172 RepID=A0A6A5XSP6_9PLEO|nr:uncharacterized protein BU24DRAFT_422032 [Aaosphaeria arxii CBS 175.79]KAF2015720.1 hypothetical protein BU24DRAFT_422032 [Aaosphaeria arxii CBS 175.79]
MSAKELDALLATSAHKTQHELLAFAQQLAGIGNDYGLGSTVDKYLQAFQDSSASASKRRWIGIVLCKLINSSTHAVSHLKEHPKQLNGLGEILLSDELAEARVIACIIMKHAMQHRLHYESFWPSDKIPNSVRNFPDSSGHEWMGKLERFLDTLHDLKVTKASNQYDIFYPVVISSADGFQSATSQSLVLFGLVQDEKLTIVTSNDLMVPSSFTDISVSGIHGTSLRQGRLYDSQDRQIPQEPWDVVISFDSAHYAYSVNGVEHHTTEFVIMLKSLDDAKYVQRIIEDIRPTNANVTHQRASTYRMRSTRVLRLGAESPQLEDDQIGDSSTFMDATLAATQTHRSEKIADSNKRNNGHASKDLSSHVSTKAQKAPAAGALPKVKKTKTAKASTSTRKRSLEAAFDDFDVPPDHPKPKSPPRKRLRGPSVSKTKETTARKLVNRKEKTGTASATPAELRQVIDSEDEDVVTDSVHTSTVKTKDQPRNTKPKSEAGDQHSRKMLASTSSRHPQERTGRRGLRAAKRVNYDEGETSDPQAIDPDFVVPKEHGSFSFKKVQKNTRITKPATSSKSTKRTRISKTQKPGSGLHSISPTKHSVLSNLVIGDSMEGHDQLLNDLAGSVMFPSSPSPVVQAPTTSLVSNTLNRETSVLNRLNEGSQTPLEDHAAMQEQDADFLQPLVLSPAPLNIALPAEPLPRIPSSPLPNAEVKTSLRRSNTDMPPPATPRYRRTFSGSDGIGDVAKSAELTHQPSSTAPSRIVDDPESPCGDRNKSQRNSASCAKKDSYNDVAAAMYGSNKLISNPHFGSQGKGLMEGRHTRTPIQNISRWLPSSGSDAVQVLSSNSKPLPAPPTAPSRAISGYSDEREVDAERRMGDFEMAKRDPFSKSGMSTANSLFTRKLTAGLAETQHTSVKATTEAEVIVLDADEPHHTPLSIRKKRSEHIGINVPSPTIHERSPVRFSRGNARPQPRDNRSGLSTSVSKVQDSLNRKTRQPLQMVQKPREADVPDREDDDFAADDTLVADDDDLLPVHITSSPPSEGGCSRGSSTSAEEAGPRSDSSLPTEEAEELKWEESLQPHQLALEKQLFRVSRRVMRHIVDHETAVTDIVDTFNRDGEQLVSDFSERNEEEVVKILDDINNRRASMQSEFQRVAESLREERRRSRSASEVAGPRSDRATIGKRKSHEIN